MNRREADELLILNLASGVTVEAAAELAGVSRATAFRRLEDEAFRQRVSEARKEMIERAVGVLSAGAVEAGATLRKLLASDSEKIRLAAARAVLELAVKVRNETEIEDRILALEQLASAKQVQNHECIDKIKTN